MDPSIHVGDALVVEVEKLKLRADTLIVTMNLPGLEFLLFELQEVNSLLDREPWESL